MYGLIHRHIRSMVIARIEPELWHLAEKEEGISATDFVGTIVYDDEKTNKIMAIACSLLGMETDEFLDEFGKYWISAMSTGSYRTFFSFCGNDIAQSMTNLNTLHDTVTVAMDGAKPPRFAITARDEKGLTISYHSERTGLSPFVIGLLRGLVAHHRQNAEVRMLGEESGAVLFRVDWVEARS